MELSIRLYALDALHPIPIEYEARWAPDAGLDAL